mgnify:CR=1 FL=1
MLKPGLVLLLAVLVAGCNDQYSEETNRTVKSLVSKTDTIGEKIDALEKRLTDIDSKIANSNTKLDSLAVILQATRTQISEIKRDSDVHSQQLSLIIDKLKNANRPTTATIAGSCGYYTHPGGNQPNPQACATRLCNAAGYRTYNEPLSVQTSLVDAGAGSGTYAMGFNALVCRDLL